MPREAWGWLVAFAINKLPDVNRGADRCCAACCGPCGALIELHRAGHLNEVLWPILDVASHDWFDTQHGGVSGAYLYARINTTCPGHPGFESDWRPDHG